MKAAPLTAMAEASHLWALRQARAAFHHGLSNRDRALPALSERRSVRLPGAAGPLEGRLYRPVGVPADAPVLLFFHGGGFLFSDLDTHEALCVRLAKAGRMRVLAARYRLAPEHRFPAQLDDAVSVTRWVLGDGVSALGPVGPVAVGGDSAGGYLAASAAALLAAEFPGALQAQLLLYPLLQLDDALWAANLLKHTRLVGWAAVRYINAQLFESDAWAPSLLAASQLAPLTSVIATGGPLDPCRADAITLAEALRSAGRRVAWCDYPGLMHGFGNMTHSSEAARDAVAEIGCLVGDILSEAG